MKTLKSPESLQKLQAKIGINFAGNNLLQTAFIHRSYLNEHKGFKGTSNERLEFLGDSILSLIVSEFLYKNLPTYTEGQLTQLRASLVRTETLSKIGRSLKLGTYLLLSKGEEESDGRNNNSILANIFESLVGAIYLDQGVETTQKFITKNILARWQILSKSAVLDNKSKLQEILQKKHQKSPIYKLARTWGPDHNRTFEVSVYLKENLLGQGVGKNKQEAAHNAAADALTRLKT